MQEFTLTGCAARIKTRMIYCPSLSGLTDRQADLAMVLPRVDNNGDLLDQPPSAPDYAGILACHPFGDWAHALQALIDAGYSGIANWPSAILFDGRTRQVMESLPATPAVEYEVLAIGQTMGLETLAFFASLDQGRQALKAGLRNLLLHPGLSQPGEADQARLIRTSLQKIIDALKEQDSEARIFVYAPPSRLAALSLDQLTCDGLVHYGEPS